MAARISPPLKWHGGKHYLAERIVGLMPPHTHYVEPYFGGGAVLLAKDPEGVSEVVNDLHGDLINFWACLRDPIGWHIMQRQLEAMPFSEADWRDAGQPDQAEGYWARSPHAPVDRAIAFFVRCRQSLAGRMKAFSPVTRTRTRRGMNEQVSSWLTAVDGLPAVHERLKRVLILNRGALDVIRQQDGPDTLFYIDPPYLHETRATTSDYACEMTREQHGELLQALAAIKGKFLLSGYRSALYDEAAAGQGWNRHDFDLPNHAAAGESKRRMTECVWVNF